MKTIFRYEHQQLVAFPPRDSFLLERRYGCQYVRIRTKTLTCRKAHVPNSGAGAVTTVMEVEAGYPIVLLPQDKEVAHVRERERSSFELRKDQR